MRTSMAEFVHEDYIWTARQRIERITFDRHAARNALLPVMSRMLVSVLISTGLVMIERIQLGGCGFTPFYSWMQNITALGMLIVIGVLSMIVRLVLMSYPI
jgi:ABC-type dipeptide/oligopeptide/nickel transport system permease component